MHFSHSLPAVLCLHLQVISPVAASKLHSDAWPLHLHLPPMARSEIPMRLVTGDDAVVEEESPSEFRISFSISDSAIFPAGKVILMSVAVTQSCRTGLCSKSSALGRSARVENAMRVPA